MLVSQCQRDGGADEHRDGLVGLERLSTEHPVGQRRPHDELAHHPRDVVHVNAEGDDTRDSGVPAEPRQSACLAFEPDTADRHPRRTARTGGERHDLDRHVPSRPTVTGQPHPGRATGAQQAARPEVRRKVSGPARRVGAGPQARIGSGIGYRHRCWVGHGGTVANRRPRRSGDDGPRGADARGPPSLAAVADTADDQLHDLVSSRLRQTELRYTASRRAIVAVLSRSDRPLTLPEILSADDSLSQSSAYRNLGELTAAGVVHRIVVSDSFAHYELAEDLSSHHHHLVCTSCGRIDDYTAPATLERELHRTLDDIVDQTGFAITAHRLDLLGTCRNCR